MLWPVIIQGKQEGNNVFAWIAAISLNMASILPLCQDCTRRALRRQLVSKKFLLQCLELKASHRRILNHWSPLELHADHLWSHILNHHLSRILITSGAAYWITDHLWSHMLITSGAAYWITSGAVCTSVAVCWLPLELCADGCLWSCWNFKTRMYV